ncbi:MAG: hypothetical protein, partial [Olavius algarvensis Gamma 1 endosymbiont]
RHCFYRLLESLSSHYSKRATSPCGKRNRRNKPC